MPDSSTPQPDAAGSDAAMRLGRRYSTLVVAGVALVALTCVTFLLPAPYVLMRPGPAFDTFGDFNGEQMFTFGDGVTTYPVDGTLDFTTVSVTRADGRLSFGDVVRGYLDDDVAVVPRDVVYPDDTTPEDSKAMSQALLTSSKDSSRVVALRAAGYEVGEKPTVVDVSAGGAADGILKVDDQITAVNGTKAATAQQVVDSVSSVDPGDVVTLGIVREGKAEKVEITTKPAEDDPDVARVGVGLGTTYDFPVEITNHVGDQVGGSSAGTMFALAIYDRLTPGALTGGLNVAGTGTMSPEGEVGAIGSVRQKMAGAAAAGADVFLVPADNCAEAVSGPDHGLRLVKVTTFDDAVSSLKKLADSASAKVPRCQ